jgi:hypothetical protein
MVKVILNILCLDKSNIMDLKYMLIDTKIRQQVGAKSDICMQSANREALKVMNSHWSIFIH